MEKIREAVARAKIGRVADDEPNLDELAPPANEDRRHQGAASAQERALPSQDVWLDARRLENNRVIAHDIGDIRSKSIDMVRTQVLQTMDLSSWQVLGVTSPTAGCGKSMLSVNLALSIARQSERSVILIDLDIQKPQVARYLGLKCDHGILSVLTGRTTLDTSVATARIGDQSIFLLPCEGSRLNSSELMASRAMSTMLTEIRQKYSNSTIILDLPPILPSDDVLSIMPQVDTVLLVAAAGQSTKSDIQESVRHLKSVPIARFVLNKSTDHSMKYYSRYGRYAKAS